MKHSAYDNLKQVQRQLFEVKQGFDTFYETFQNLITYNHQIQNSLSLSQNLNTVFSNLNASQSRLQENINHLDMRNLQEFSINQEPSRLDLENIEQYKFIENQKENIKNILKTLKNMRFPWSGIENLALKMLVNTLIFLQKIYYAGLNVDMKEKKVILQQKGGGRRTQDPMMEKKLFSWYQDQLSKGVTVNAVDLKKMSKDLIHQRYKGSFKASKGWLEKFLKRNNITQINKDNYDKSNTNSLFKNSQSKSSNQICIFSSQSQISDQKSEGQVSNILKDLFE